MQCQIRSKPRKRLMLISMILAISIGSISFRTQALSSSVFGEMAKKSGGIVVTPPKPNPEDNVEDGECSTISSVVFNIIMGTIRPTVTAVKPMQVPRDSTADLLIIAPNANFNSSSSVQILQKDGSNSGIIINDTMFVSATRIQANVTVPTDLAVMFYDVLVTTQMGSSTPETAKGTCALEIVEKPTNPQILSITPGTVTQDSTEEMDIKAINTQFDSTTPIVDLGDGINVTVKEVVSPTHLKINLQVEQNASTGFRHVVVTTGSEVARDTQIGGEVGALLVLSSDYDIPEIKSITPEQGQPGQTITNMELQAEDTHFTASSTLDFAGTGVTATAIEVKSATQIVATVAVAVDATPGYRDVFVTTGEETATLLNGFQIQANHAPTDITLSKTSIHEDQPNDSVIGTFLTTDPDNFDTHTYTLEDNAGGRFKIVGHELQVANASLLLEKATQASHDIMVKSVDKGELPVTKTFTIQVESDTPTDIMLSHNFVLEYSPIATEIGTLSTTDPNLPNDSHTYTLLDDADGRFTIEDNRLLVANQQQLTADDYAITIRTTDSLEKSWDKEFTITVEPTDNVAPTDILLSNQSVLVGSVAETIIGEFSTTDANSQDTHTYSLTDDADGYVKIIDNRLIANQDLATVEKYQITVTSTDNLGLPFDKDFTILVKDILLSNQTIPANSVSGTEIGQWTMDSPVIAETHHYHLITNPEERFQINEDRLQVANQSLLQEGNYRIKVGATDNHDSILEKEFLIAVTTKNPLPPPVFSLSNNTVSVDSSLGAQIGVFSTTASSDGLTYTLIKDTEGSFAIEGTRLLVEESLVRVGDYDITVRLTDSADLLVEKNFTITVTSTDGKTEPTPNPNDDKPQENSVLVQFANNLLVLDELATSSTTLPSSEELSGYFVKVPVNRTANTKDNVVVNYEIESDSLVADEDYFDMSPEPGTLTWLAEETNKPISLFVVANGAETFHFNLLLSNPSNNAELGTPSEMELVLKTKTKPVEPDEPSPPSPQQPTQECTHELALFLQAEQENITLTLGEEPLRLTFTGGQDIDSQNQRELTHSPDKSIVTVKSNIFPREGGAILTLAPVAVGETYLVISDCASNARVKIKVVEPLCKADPTLALQTEQPEIVLALGEDSTMVPFMGGQMDIELLTSFNNEVAAAELLFTESGEARLQLQPRKVGHTQIIVKDCASEVLVDVTVKSQCDLIEQDSAFALKIKPENLIAVAKDNPISVPITGGQGDIKLTQTRNSKVATAEILLSQQGQAVLMLTPLEAGQAQFIINDCVSQVPVNLTVLPEPPNTFGINAKGEKVESSAYFDIKLSTSGRSGQDFWVGPQETVTAGINLTIDPAHIGQAASLIILVEHQISPFRPQHFMLDNDTWKSWDGKLTSLVAANTYSRLSKTQPMTVTLELEQLPLERFEGQISFWVGYRLGDGTLIVNAENSPRFNIANGMGLDVQENPVNTSAHFDSYLSIDGEPKSNHLLIGHTDTITANMSIQVDQAHLGQPASLLIVAIHTSGEFFMYDGTVWQPWYGDLPGIVMAEFIAELPAILTIAPLSLNALPLARLSGEWTIYLGYRVEDVLEDGEDNQIIIFNGLNPLHFFVGNGVGISLFNYETLKTASHFEVSLRTQAGFSGNHLEISQTDEAEIELTIQIDSADIGQAARLILTAQLMDEGNGEEEKSLFIHDGFSWQPWDDDLNNLTPAHVYDKLPARLTSSKPLSLETLPFDTLPAQLKIYVGYHLGNENFIYGGETPLHIKVIEKQAVTQTEDKITCLFCD